MRLVAGRGGPNESPAECLAKKHFGCLVAKLRAATKDVVIVLGEAVGLVADVLQQPQGLGMPREP